MKRSFCKYCDSPLVPGVTAIVRLSCTCLIIPLWFIYRAAAKKGTHQVLTCMTCQKTKKIRLSGTKRERFQTAGRIPYAERKASKMEK